MQQCGFGDGILRTNSLKMPQGAGDNPGNVPTPQHLTIGGTAWSLPQFLLVGNRWGSYL